jgi:hypothetical protein
VGTITGFKHVIQKSDAGYEGWYKAALGISLGKGYTVVVVKSQTTTPGDDSRQVIAGKVPSEWNRQAIDEALRGVAIVGNLAALTIKANVRLTPADPVNGARITGRVTDTVGDAVVGVKVRLRKSNADPVNGAVTTAIGAFTLAVPKKAGTGSFVLSVAGLSKNITVR